MRPTVPTGTVTLLFTDIEGSTVRWERDSTSMHDAIRRHDEIARSQIERHGGYVFKTIGDAFCAAFERPDEAVRAAVDIQLTLAAEDFGSVGGLRVRIALHAGTTHERDGDYFGPTVNRVARLLAIGHGGQILASGIVAELMRDRLPAGFRFADLGSHKLKDLARDEHVYQVDSAGRDLSFPALRTLDARPHNLPTMLTSFVGREREVRALDALVAKHRVVTIVGSGGIGKTRTSARVAAAALGRFPDGVWFVELASLTSGALVPATIAATIGVELALGPDLTESLTRALKSKCMLLVLDNCEHLVAPVAHLVDALVAGAPDVSVLASSREPLRIAAEVAYRIPTLTLPGSGERLSAQSALQFEALQLFVERATALDPAFALTDATAPIVADICRKLDGIALAIELAAARVRVLAPAQLLDRLDHRLRLLTSVGRTTPPRQQTLQALIDWSYDLLGTRERLLFVRLGIFAEGFTLEAAAAVCSDVMDDFELLDLLASLVDKSLVVAEVDREPPRYRLLDSMRAYASQRLARDPDHGAVTHRHLTYYADLLDASEREYARTRGDASLSALNSEIDNVRAALTYAFAGGEATTGARLLGASRHVWRRWGASAEGIDRCVHAAQMMSPVDSTMTARLWNVVSFLAYKTGRTVTALEAAEAAVVAARAANDASVIVDALLCRALPLMFAGRVDDAEADLREAETTLVRDAAVIDQIRLVEARGLVKSWRHEYREAAIAFTTLAQLHRANRNLEGEVHATCNLAECEHASGATDRAIAALRAVLPYAQTLGRSWHGNVLANLAGYLCATSDVAASRSAARAAIELQSNDSSSPIVANALEHFALTLALDGESERAALLLGYCDATKAANGFRRQFTEQTTHDRLRELLEARHTPSELAALVRAGEALTAAAAFEVALSTTTAT